MSDERKWWEKQIEEAEREYANASPWLRALMDQVYKEVTTHGE